MADHLLDFSWAISRQRRSSFWCASALFQGGALDADLGLYHFGARWYDPSNGIWISQDPMSFAVGDNGPTNGTDPSG